MRDKVFTCIIIFFLFLIPTYVFFRNEKDFSVAENRTLFKKENINIMNFSDGINSLIEDQFLFGETLKKKYNIFKNKIISISIRAIEKKRLMNLIPMGGNLYRIANTDYYVYGSNDVNTHKDEYLYNLNRINELSRKHKNIKFYVYNHTVDTSVVNQKQFNEFIENTLDDNIKFKYSTWINSYEEYQKYFYKTDHHWNKDGSYMGYIDIVEMLNIQNKIEIKGSKKIDDIKFFGSKARILGNYDRFDEFYVNIFDYPDMYIESNYIHIDDYGKAKLYFENNVNNVDEETNHYGEFYGWDDGIIRFKVEENQDKGNLLIFSNSYSNAINKLIASGYAETYVVDMRNYEVQIGKKFNFDNFVNEHNIDKVLIIGNDNYFSNEKNYID